jgi:transposase
VFGSPVFIHLTIFPWRQSSRCYVGKVLSVGVFAIHFLDPATYDPGGMDVQPLYRLVVWSPISLLFPILVEESRSSTLSTAAGPPASRPTSRLCPACPSAAEWLELRQQAGYWKSHYERSKQGQDRLRQQLAELQEKNWQRLYEQTQERERVLQEQVTALKAQISVLEHRLRGRKSEKKKKHPETLATNSSATTGKPTNGKRGQQPTNPPPSRRTFAHLPTAEEPCQLPADKACCSNCGAAFASFPGTDDGDIIEIDIRAHRRRYRRHRYRKTCTCSATPAVITAPPPPKLIRKGYLGISVWVLLLLEKYAAYQPTYRFLSLLRSFGIDLPLGTVTDGLKKLVPLFEPLYLALCAHQRQEHHWHCDETRWLVFIEHQGKAGHNWNLWAFRSRAAVVYVLDPTRAHHVPEKHLAGATGIASVDRASVYKAMAQVKRGQIILAFCWAHVRRDFLEVLTGYAALSDWVISWLEEIRELYRRNNARLEVLTAAAAGAANSTTPPCTTPPCTTPPCTTPPCAKSSVPPPLANDKHNAAVPSSNPSPAVTAAERHLREHVAHLAERRDAELQRPDLHSACTKVLTSLRNHWSGLTVFLDHPEVPLDNNAAERAERGPVVARKNYYGSGALWSGRLAAMMFSLLQTLALWNLCPLRWLTAYLTACAEAGSKPPEKATAFLPWNLTAEQKQQWALPSSQPQGPDAANSS